MLPILHLLIPVQAVEQHLEEQHLEEPHQVVPQPTINVDQIVKEYLTPVLVADLIIHVPKTEIRV